MTRHRRAVRSVSLLALAIAAFAPPAWSGDWTWDGGISAGLGVDSNVFGTTNVPEHDAIFTLAPRASLSMDREGSSVSVFAEAEIGRYARFDDEDYVDGEIGIKADHRLVEDLRVFGGLEHAWAHEGRDDPDDAAGLEPTLYRRFGGWAGAEFSPDPWSFRAGALFNAYDYDDVPAATGTIDNDYRDRVQAELGLRALRDIGEGRAVFVEGVLETRRYDRETPLDRDATGWSAAVGLKGDLLSGALGDLKGEASVGIMTLSRSDPSMEDEAALDLGLAAIWRPAPATLFRVALDRSIEETTVTSDGVAASGYVSTDLDFRLSRAVSPRLSLGMSAGWADHDYIGVARDDHVLRFGVDARWRLTPHVWIGPELRHVERNSSEAGEDFSADIIAIRIGADLAPAWAMDAPPPDPNPRTGVYVGAALAHGGLVTSLDGPRGSGGTNLASFGDEGFGGLVFAGWRAETGGVIFGIEAEAELADRDWTHDGDRYFSVQRSDLYAVSALGGMALPGGATAYVRGGPVNAAFRTAYAAAGAATVSEERLWGLRAGVGIETPISPALSLRAEYVVTGWENDQVGVNGDPDDFASVEGEARLGLLWRFGAEAQGEAEAAPMDFGGFYAGGQIAHGMLAADNVGERTGFTLDAERAGMGAGAGLFAGWGMTFGRAYLGAEIDGEISSVDWTAERAPTGRVYDMKKPWSLGASARAGWMIGDAVLVYGRVGAVASRFEVDYATTGFATAKNDTLTGLRVGVGVEAALTDRLRMRIDYSRTGYQGLDLPYSAGRVEHFDPTETQVRVGLAWAF